MIYKAYKDDCYLIGICSDKGLFDGYVDISPAEFVEFGKVETEFYKWQDILRRRYKKRYVVFRIVKSVGHKIWK